MYLFFLSPRIHAVVYKIFFFVFNSSTSQQKDELPTSQIINHYKKINKFNKYSSSTYVKPVLN